MSDNQGQSPYDLAVAWGHPKSLLKIMLLSCPSVDRDAFLKVIYLVVFNFPLVDYNYGFIAINFFNFYF